MVQHHPMTLASSSISLGTCNFSKGIFHACTTIIILFSSPNHSFSLFLAATVEFLQPVFPVGEGQGSVSVCLTIDAPIATPLTVSFHSQLMVNSF